MAFFKLGRVPHILKPHKGNRTPVNFLFFDTETIADSNCKVAKTSRQILSFGFAYAFRMENGERTREQWCRFETSKAFFEFMESRLSEDRPLYCFAHNLGFDLTIVDFWNYCSNPDYTIDYFVLDDPPSFIIGKHKERKFILLDTLNYWRQSLKVIAKSLGMEKLEMPAGCKSKKKWDTYCKRDVEILANAVCGLKQYIQTHDLGQFGLSAASISMSSFRHRFMKHEIFIHDNVKALGLERQAYYGGLVECFYLGRIKQQNIYKLDVNSMYPHVMLNEFPVKLLEYNNKPCHPKQCPPKIGQGGIYDCQINSTHATYPIRLENKLCYARGDFHTYLCEPEYKRAYYNGDVKLVRSYCRYDTKRIFGDYIHFFWRQRQEYRRVGDENNQYFVKIFMNSLYGKFGQLGYGSAELHSSLLEAFYAMANVAMPAVYKEKGTMPTNGIPQSHWKPLGLDKPLTLRQIGNKITVKVPTGEHAESFPAISAFVTSYARELLLSYIKTAGKGNTYYCDTDSLFVNKRGYDALKAAGFVDQTTLGKLKLEGISTNTEFNGLKDYVFDGDSKLKGIRKDAKQIAYNKWEQVQFEGVRSILNRGYAPFVDVRTITKQLSRKYTKGIKASNGFIIPFNLPEDLDYALRAEI